MMLGAGFFFGASLPCFDFRNLVFTCERVFHFSFMILRPKKDLTLISNSFFQAFLPKKRSPIGHVSIIGSNRYGYVMEC
jgi:hypothetical protein